MIEVIITGCVLWPSAGLWAWMQAYRYFTNDPDTDQKDVVQSMYPRLLGCILMGPFSFIINIGTGIYKKSK